MEKLLAIISLSQNIYGRWLFRQLLSRIILIISLAIVTSMMLGALLISGFYVAYVLLLHTGYDPQTALIIVGSAGVILTLLVFMITLNCMRRLRNIPRELLQRKSPTISQVTDVIDGFLEGFTRAPEKHHK